MFSVQIQNAYRAQLTHIKEPIAPRVGKAASLSNSIKGPIITVTQVKKKIALQIFDIQLDRWA